MSGAKQMNMILVSTKAFNLDVITFADLCPGVCVRAFVSGRLCPGVLTGRECPVWSAFTFTQA